MAALCGLLGGVGRGVVSRLRVHRQQESDRQHQEPEAEARRGAVEVTRVVDPLGEDEVRALVCVGHEDQQADDDRDPDHVPSRPRCC